MWGEGEQEMFHDKLIFTQVGDVSPLLIWACTGSRRSDVQKNEMFDYCKTYCISNTVNSEYVSR